MELFFFIGLRRRKSREGSWGDSYQTIYCSGANRINHIYDDVKEQDGDE